MKISDQEILVFKNQATHIYDIYLNVIKGIRPSVELKYDNCYMIVFIF